MEKTYWLHAVSPLHVGAGRGVGYIDLPIVREKVTNWPYVPGSAVKGVIADRRNATEKSRKENRALAAAFGVIDGDASDNAGSIVFSDASIVCLPVRSFYGTFAWITAPLVLSRLRGLGIEQPPVPKDTQTIITAEGGSAISPNGKIYLEDIDLDEQANAQLKPWRDLIAEQVFAGNDEWQKVFKSRFALVSDDIFTFLCETGTEVNARIRINDETKIVANGALWYEESLPIDTILSGVVWCDKVYGGGVTRDALMKEFCEDSYDLQIGGKATTGKGRVRCVFS
ncbi:type III-B CRISPR module RAMP protein Cmr4 [Synergistales bacterium]|nr:type III-B CRISPR module RAMP protein Cmr4 [Synergistales bacterium]